MIVVDVETTGLYPKENSIVSIGALDFSNPENQFYEECRIWEGAKIDPVALEINGFTLEQITDPNKQSLEVLMKNFILWRLNIKDRTFSGHNAWFDRDFLIDSAERCSLHPYTGKGYSLEKGFGKRYVDLHSQTYTHYLSRGLKPPLKNRRTDIALDVALDYVGLPKESKPHNALAGAKMEAEAFSRLIYGKSLLKEFSQYAIPDYLLKT